MRSDVSAPGTNSSFPSAAVVVNLVTPTKNHRQEWRCHVPRSTAILGGVRVPLPQKERSKPRHGPVFL